MRTSQHSLDMVSAIGIDVDKNTFHLDGLDAVRLFCSRRSPVISLDAGSAISRAA